ncbi:MAG: FAD-dependent thymidylate synthase [Synergistaceae bacterium]|nr:FAD-dependent thymidylate synthase [Synergistaceae bacterium]
MSCRVSLLSYTPDPDKLVLSAARLCYSETSAEKLFENFEFKNPEKFILDLRQSGHLSTFEHASFTFTIDGLSRVASHQLVRHRIASFSQQSQRYVKMNKLEAVTPESISRNPDALKLYTEQIERSHESYVNLINMGIPAEDARFILPHSWETKIVMTMNARELHHFFSLRTCRRAQWEIQGLARRMLFLVRKAAPLLFNTAGPKCLISKCEEAHPCGRPYKNMDNLFELEDLN